MKRFLICFVFFATAGIAGLSAQPVLYVSTGSNVYISAGQLVSFDSLVLTPSAGFNIAGLNSLTRNTSTSNYTSKPSVQRSYKFSNTLSSYSGDISIYYQSAELNSLSPSSLQLNIFGASQWTNYPSVPGTNVVSVTGLSNVSVNEIALASSAQPLPVLWLSVSGYALNNLNHVNWSTADEVNCKNYIVQKSADGSSWHDVSYSIAAYNTSGNHQYSWVDSSVVTAVSYYRVRQADYDNNDTYSAIIIVKSEGISNLSLYPNPVVSKIYISTGNAGKLINHINLFDSEGRLVASTALISAMQYSVDVARLSKGIYNISILLSDGSTAIRTFIKQ